MLLSIDIQMPEKRNDNLPRRKSVEDRVRESLELIDSGYCSDIEWLMINKLHKQLVSMPGKNSRIRNLIDMIEATMRKYGYHGVGTEE